MARVRRDNDARYALRAAFVDENGDVLSGDTITINSVAVGISATDVSNWNTAYSWGDHALAGYLTSFTETDPTVPSHVKSITTTEKANWNTAFGWGDHAAVGYGLAANDYWTAITGGIEYTGGLTTVDNVVLGGSGTIGGTTWASGTFHLGTDTAGWAMDANELYNSTSAIIGTLEDNSTLTLNPKGSTTTSKPFISTNTITASGGDSSQWNTAYGWGDHGAVDYFVNNSTVALSTTNSITSLSGDGVGNIALTNNDGGGNSNLVFNEVGTAKYTAGYNSGRIHVNTDITANATMMFKVGSGAANASERAYLSDAGWTVYGTLRGDDQTANAPTFSFINDTNTGMFSAAADKLGFSTGGLTRMTIDASATQINKKLTLNSGDFNDHLQFIRAGEDWWISPSTDGSLQVGRTAGTGSAEFRSNASFRSLGSITADVDMTARYLRAKGPATGTGEGGQLSLNDVDGNSTNQGIVDIDTLNNLRVLSQGAGDLQFGVNSSVKMVVKETDGGHVGIGTTVPYTSASYRVLEVKGQNTLAGGYLRLSNTTGGTQCDVFNYNSNLYHRNDGQVIFEDVAATPRMRLIGDSLIVGNSASVQTGCALTVVDNGGGLSDDARMSFNGRAAFGYDGTRSSVLISDNTSGTTATKNIVFDSAGSERMRINTDGTVCVGRAATGREKFEVNGAILTTNATYTSNQDNTYLIAGTANHTGAITNWGTYGFQHKFKANAGGTPRVTIDDKDNEIVSFQSSIGDPMVGINSSDTKIPSALLHMFQKANDAQNGIRQTYANGAGTHSWTQFVDGSGRHRTVYAATPSSEAVTTSLYLEVDGDVGIGGLGSDGTGYRNLTIQNPTSTQAGGKITLKTSDGDETRIFNYTDAASPSMYYEADTHIFRNMAGTVTAQITSAGLLTSVSNITTVGTVTAGGVTMGTTTLRNSTDRAGLLESHGTIGWQGFQATSGDEHLSLMVEQGGAGGIYDDTDSQWVVFKNATNNVSLLDAGVAKLTTKSTGVTVTGDVGCTTVTATGEIAGNTVKGTWTNNGTANSDAKIVVLTQAEYNAIGTKDSNTLYITT